VMQQREQLETRLLELQGDTVALRERERATIYETNLALYDQITALQDSQAAAAAAAQAEADLADQRNRALQDAERATDSAFASVQRAIQAEAQAAQVVLTSAFDAQMNSIERAKTAANAARDAASETLKSAKRIFDFLSEQIADLRGSVGAGMSAAAGRAFIAQATVAARATGTLPDADALAQAVAAARGDLDSTRFGNAFEQRRATLLLANSLSALQQFSGEQLTTAERALQVAEDELNELKESAKRARDLLTQQLDAIRDNANQQMAAAQSQLDALRGIDSSVLTVAQSLQQLAASIAAEAQARAAARSSSGASNPSVGDVPSNSAPGVNSAYNHPSGVQVNASDAALIAAAKVVYQSATGGVSTAQFDSAQAAVGGDIYQATGWNGDPASFRAKWGFAAGGLHTGGLRMVGELGPEIEVTGPARYYSTSQTQSMLGGGTAVADELRQLREENRAQARALVQLQSRMTRLLERWDGDGLPEERAVAA